MSQIEGVYTENTAADVDVVSVYGMQRQGRTRPRRVCFGDVTVCTACRERLYKPGDTVVKHKGGTGPLARACCRCFKCGATRIYGLQPAA